MTLTINLDPDTEKRLVEVAAARGVTPETLVAEAVTAYWDDLDDVEEDLRRLDEGGESVSLDEAFDALRTEVARLRESRG